MKSRFTWALTSAAVMAFLLLSTVLGSAQIYEQDTDLNGAFASQNDTNGLGNFAKTFGNFSLHPNVPPGGSASVTGVAWVGSYFNPPMQGPITGFTIEFYADSGGIPGSSLSAVFFAGNAGETFLGNDNVGDPTYTYFVNLPSALGLSVGTQYWLSIVPDLGFPPQWGWETSSQGDGVAYQCFFGSCDFVPSDVAFALYGTITSDTPEPGTLILVGTGLLGAALRRFRRS